MGYQMMGHQPDVPPSQYSPHIPFWCPLSTVFSSGDYFSMTGCENVTELDEKEDVYVKITLAEIQLKVVDFLIFVRS
jgi:hypothetical protein